MSLEPMEFHLPAGGSLPDRVEVRDLVQRVNYKGQPWPNGPWDDEPDRRYWVNEDGLPCLILRNHNGALCGYVAVTPDHPLHGVHYSDVDVEVHGGLTYSDLCTEHPHHICHVPEPGEPDDVWWFGFDCGHFQDLTPGMMDIFPGENATYRDFNYVATEVEDLAKQLTAK